MQRQGLIRHIGLSEVDVAQIEQARRFFPVVSVQNRYNLADRHWEDVLAYCEREGIAFIPWYPLGAGSTRHTAALARRCAGCWGEAERRIRRDRGRSRAPRNTVADRDRVAAAAIARHAADPRHLESCSPRGKSPGRGAVVTLRGVEEAGRGVRTVSGAQSVHSRRNRFTSESIVALFPVTKNARIFCDSGSLVYPSIRATTRVCVLSIGSK